MQGRIPGDVHLSIKGREVAGLKDGGSFGNVGVVAAGQAGDEQDTGDEEII
jgi:hypothetical protein